MRKGERDDVKAGSEGTEKEFKLITRSRKLKSPESQRL